jgi:hypothetical protein
MARGWESKAIESQQEDARHRARPGRPLTEAEREQLTRRTNLELALAGAQSELLAACRPAHREMLRLKLEAIRAQLSELDAGVQEGT